MEITCVESFLRYFEGVRARTRRVVECVPEQDLEWRPAEGRFSCGDLIRHIAATERYMFTENVSGRPSAYPGHGRELATGLPAVLAYFDRLHEESITIAGALTPEDLQRRCVTPAGTEIRVWKWLRAMVEHEVHHRGQLYSLLADLGVATPPIYGLTEPEVLENSPGSVA